MKFTLNLLEKNTCFHKNLPLGLNFLPKVFQTICNDVEFSEINMVVFQRI